MCQPRGLLRGSLIRSYSLVIKAMHSISSECKPAPPGPQAGLQAAEPQHWMLPRACAAAAAVCRAWQLLCLPKASPSPWVFWLRLKGQDNKAMTKQLSTQKRASSLRTVSCPAKHTAVPCSQLEVPQRWSWRPRMSAVPRVCCGNPLCVSGSRLQGK